MKPRHFVLSPLLYILIVVGIAAEAIFFLPNSYHVYMTQPTTDNLPLVGFDGLVLLVLVLALTVTVTIADGIIRLRVLGIPFSRIALAEMESVTPLFPFATFQKKGDAKNKARFCPAVSSKKEFFEAVTAAQPELRIESARKNPSPKA